MLKEKLENLSKQKEQLEFATIKVIGAIELIQAMIADEEKVNDIGNPYHSNVKPSVRRKHNEKTKTKRK